MAFIEEQEGEILQTDLMIFPIVDVSGSMAGEKIGQVNDGMRSMKPQLQQIQGESIEKRLLIAPMEFSTGARWMYNAPQPVENYDWMDMKASGVTDFGAACELLSKVLTVRAKGGWMDGRGGSAPVLLLISDGAPTDNYKKALETLKNRGWFKAALKFAIAVGEGADKDMLAEFTGNIEAVLEVSKFSDLSAVIKTTVVSASKTMSSSNSSSLSKVNTNPDAEVGDIDYTQEMEDANKETVQQVKSDLSKLSLDGDY